jgi:hypothetical protein
MPPSRPVLPPDWLRLLRQHQAHIPAAGTALVATALVAGTTAAVAAEPIADREGALRCPAREVGTTASVRATLGLNVSHLRGSILLPAVPPRLDCTMTVFHGTHRRGSAAGART